MKVLEKENIRKKLLRKRESLSDEEVLTYSKRITQGIKDLGEYKKAQKVLLYYPVKKEPDITGLMGDEKTFMFPKVSGDELILYEVKELKDLEEGSFGIKEPACGKETDPEEIEIAFVPGIAFDERGFRVGFGKGYYDRLLSKVKGVKVGVCYDFQVFKELPTDYWDIPVDLIITQSYILKGGKRHEY